MESLKVLPFRERQREIDQNGQAGIAGILKMPGYSLNFPKCDYQKSIVKTTPFCF